MNPVILCQTKFESQSKAIIQIHFQKFRYWYADTAVTLSDSQSVLPWTSAKPFLYGRRTEVLVSLYHLFATCIIWYTIRPVAISFPVPAGNLPLFFFEYQPNLRPHIWKRTSGSGKNSEARPLDGALQPGLDPAVIQSFPTRLVHGSAELSFIWSISVISSMVFTSHRYFLSVVYKAGSVLLRKGCTAKAKLRLMGRIVGYCTTITCGHSRLPVETSHTSREWVELWRNSARCCFADQERQGFRIIINCRTESVQKALRKLCPSLLGCLIERHCTVWVWNNGISY